MLTDEVQASYFTREIRKLRCSRARETGQISFNKMFLIIILFGWLLLNITNLNLIFILQQSSVCCSCDLNVLKGTCNCLDLKTNNSL